MKRLLLTAFIGMLCGTAMSKESQIYCWDNQDVDMTTDWRDANSISDFNWTVPNFHYYPVEHPGGPSQNGELTSVTSPFYPQSSIGFQDNVRMFHDQ